MLEQAAKPRCPTNQAPLLDFMALDELPQRPTAARMYEKNLVPILPCPHLHGGKLHQPVHSFSFERWGFPVRGGTRGHGKVVVPQLYN